MSESFLEEAEKKELFRREDKNYSNLMFHALGSAGRNPVKLAQILSVFDNVMLAMGWQGKPLANLSKFLTQYQASVDAKYHDDFKEVLIAEEIERRRAERKGVSIIQDVK